MPVDVRSHCGEPSSVLESCNLCERPRENQKGCRRISEQRAVPLPILSQTVITDNTFHISQREVIYPSQVEPVAAVMPCGCLGYAMMSFQRKIGFNLGGLAVLVFFKLRLFFFFLCIQNSRRDISKPNPLSSLSGAFPPRCLSSLPLPPLSRAGAERWILTGKWAGHTVYCQPQRPLWPLRDSLWREPHFLHHLLKCQRKIKPTV